jgi:hypothetical protein
VLGADDGGALVTKLMRTVKRTVAARPRPLVVILHPPIGDHPALIELREAGRRTGYTITLGALFTILAQREADRGRPARRRGRLA